MKYKKGDKVRVVSNYHIRSGSEGKVVVINDDCKKYGIEFEKFVSGHDLTGVVKYGYGWWVHEDQLELVKPYKKNLRDMEVGDIVITHHVSEVKVLALCGELFSHSRGSDHESFYGWVTFTDAEILGWKLKDSKSEVETIEVEGKKYKKSDLLERIKELEEVK